MGLFCGIGTIATSQILPSILKAQVGPCALKWRQPKGQGVAQLFVALCELCPVNPAQGVLCHLIWLVTTQVTGSRTG